MPNFALGDHYEKFVERQLESGRYDNASEVVRTALGIMEDFEEAHEKWLRDEIPNRHEELLKDPSKGVPANVVRSRFEAKHRERLAAAK